MTKKRSRDEELYSYRRVKELLDDIERQEGTLTSWERSFVDEMFQRWHHRRSFSDKQMGKLQEIYDAIPSRQA